MVDRKNMSTPLHQSKSCLLIDDDEDDKEIFFIALAEANPKVHCFTADDGIQALTMLKDESFVPDYIFLDLNMPLMSGKECLAEIRKRKHLDQTPVIIYSTSASQKDVQETHELGASGFITKPPLLGALIEKLVEVFEEQSVDKRR